MNALRLVRASQDVRSFLSVLGSLRETRLTAVLGYLCSCFPDEFGPLLGFRPSSTDEIHVEETEKGDRYDVLVRQSGGDLVIEGKLGPSQNLAQLQRYLRRRTRTCKPSLTVVDDGSEYLQSRSRCFVPVRKQVAQLKFVTWAQVAVVCRDIARRRRAFRRSRTGAVIAQELAAHLEENNMTNDAQPEIYLRDMSSISSVQLFFRHRIYKCQSKYYNSARRNLYFAPYFTKQMANKISEQNLVPVGEGISFVSRVEAVQVVDTCDVLNFLKDHDHGSAKEAARIIRKIHRSKDVLIMLLGEPRLLLPSPVTKAKLSEIMPFGTGAMGSRSCSFDSLLAASQR